MSPSTHELVTGARFVEYELRDAQLVGRPPAPPGAGQCLMGRKDDVAARPRREIAHDAGFDVDRVHDAIVSRHGATQQWAAHGRRGGRQLEKRSPQAHWPVHRVAPPSSNEDRHAAPRVSRSRRRAALSRSSCRLRVLLTCSSRRTCGCINPLAGMVARGHDQVAELVRHHVPDHLRQPSPGRERAKLE